jgi:hypothetical protein
VKFLEMFQMNVAVVEQFGGDIGREPIIFFKELELEGLNEATATSVDDRTTDTRPGDSFVDDTTTCATDDNHNLDPIPSTVRGLTQEEDSLVARMEVIIQFFLDVLQVMGGDLAPKKCAWYLKGHRYNKGVSKLIQVEPQHRSITMTPRSSGLISGIKRKSPTDGHRTLGIL